MTEISCSLKSKPTKIFTNKKRAKDTFQFVHYLVCISNVTMIESREKPFREERNY